MIDNVIAGETIDPNWGNAVADAINGFVESDTYTPTWSGLNPGSGGSAANSCGYRFIGGTELGDRGILALTGNLVLGSSGASVSGAVSFTLPPGFQLQTEAVSALHRLGLATIRSNIGAVQRESASALAIVILNASGTYLSATNLSASVPSAWGAGDIIRYDAQMAAVRV